MKKITPWKLLKESESLGPAGWMRIITKQYELPNGNVSNWDLLYGGGRTIATLCLTPDNRVLLVRQYRPGPDRVLDEMPGGYIDKGEDPLDAARRELLEESGWDGDIELVGSTWLSSTALTQRFVAVARNCRKVDDQQEDDGEYIEPITKSLEDFIAQVRKGEMTDTDLAYMALDYAGLLPGQTMKKQ
ncbi:MAG TPA: NUDIX hydrolase [Candidatus Saccharimonadales bacterium]